MKTIIMMTAQARYHVYHFHVVHDATSKSERRRAGWDELLGHNCIVLQNYQELSQAIASIVVDTVSPTHVSPSPASALGNGGGGTEVML